MALEIGRWLRGILTENLNLKLLSLAFALVFYAIVHEAQDSKRDIDVKVERQEPPDSADRVLVTPPPPQIRITFRGPRSMINELNTDNVGPVKLDLRAGTESRITFDQSMVPVPPGVKVEQISPPSIDLQWEERLERDVPVQVSVAGKPGTGYVVKGVPVAEPPNVRVRGPKSEVIVLQHVRADPFDVTGLSEEKKHSRTLALDRPRGRVTFDITNVRVDLEIAGEVTERAFTKVPIAVVGQTKGKTLPAEVDVRLTCPPDIVRALRPEQLVPRVEATSTAEHGSESKVVELKIDHCQATITPQSVVVKW